VVHMQKLFTKILVPVNFNRNTRWSVEKAVQLANKFGCDILLLHVESPTSVFPFLFNTYFSGSLVRSDDEFLKKKMKEVMRVYKPKLKEGLIMTSVITAGYWQTVIKDVIVTEHIDLALIPRNQKRLGGALIYRISINKLSQQTNCPIMTITRNLNANHLQNIVVPVFDPLPLKKLTMATYLSFETGGCIYLMGKDDSATSRHGKGHLMRAYQLLNEFGKMDIHCALQGSEDSGSSTLAFARNVKANLIVVNPGQESRLRGLWNKLRGKYLCRESDIPVLTVAV
jgi:hypothetical protein